MLFLIVLLAEGGLDLVRQTSSISLSGNQSSWDVILKQIISFILISVWFFVLFRLLPDGRPTGKTLVAGAVFTSLLFTAGKLLLKWLLTYTSMEKVYGPSTSSVLLLLFVFYSSFIFYYGACFTKIWAETNAKSIPPAEYAEKYEWSHVTV